MPGRKFGEVRGCLLLFALSVALGARWAAAATPPPGFVENVVVPGPALATPVGFDYEPGTGNVFILEKGPGTRPSTATVRRLDRTTGQLTTALSIPCVDSRGERGLLGIAFDPFYADGSVANRYVYLFYSRFVDVSGACAISDVTNGEYNWVARYTESQGTLGGEDVLLRSPMLGAQNHNGGTLRFGTDNTLYVSMGDNDTETLPVPLARDLGDVRGKILRIERDGSIPPDNPFVGQAGARPEIWAWGLRNPFRFSVDSESGTLYLADVGEGRWEEIDTGIAGADYGWPCFEGPESFLSCSPPPAPGSDTKPAYAYGHQGQTFPIAGNSVTGGPVYRGSSFPAEYHGVYFFGDYADGWVRRGRLGPDGTLGEIELFLTNATNVVDMNVSPAGCLGWVGIAGEGLREVCYVGGGNGQPQARSSAAPASGLAPLTVQFDGSASSDPDGDPLAYAWSFGDASSGAGVSPLKTYGVNGVYDATLTVDDGRAAPNSTDAAPPLRIVVGNRAPSPAISQPPVGARYDAGDTIAFSGSGSDPEDGALPASAFSWTIVFHHGDHTHPFLGPIGGVTSGSFTVPTTGESATDVFYRVRLTTTDSGAPLGADGRLSASAFRDVHPNLATITVDAVPQHYGLQLAIDQLQAPTPWSKESIVKFPRTLTAPATQPAGGASWEFVSWSDGGVREHVVATPPSATTYVATYRCIAGCTTDQDGDGMTAAGGDCDDTRASVKPGLDELCDGLDNDCDGAVDERGAPGFMPGIVAARLSGAAVRFSWPPVFQADRYDVVSGSLATLRSTGGDFSSAVTACTGDDIAGLAIDDAAAPAPGQGSFFVGRAVNCRTPGTYDQRSTTRQVGSRDAEIDAAPASCP